MSAMTKSIPPADNVIHQRHPALDPGVLSPDRISAVLDHIASYMADSVDMGMIMTSGVLETHGGGIHGTVVHRVRVPNAYAKDRYSPTIGM